MPLMCAIRSCKSTRGKGDGIRFHSFPKDPDIQKKWVFVCQKPVSVNSSRICSKHFLDSDYERNLMAELLNYEPVTKKLKKEAVPSLAIPENISLELRRMCELEENSEFKKKVDVATNTINYKCLTCPSHKVELYSNRKKLKRMLVSVNMAQSEINALKSKISSLGLQNKTLMRRPRRKLKKATNTLQLKCLKCSVHEAQIKSGRTKLNEVLESEHRAKIEIRMLKSQISSLETENKILKEMINSDNFK